MSRIFTARVRDGAVVTEGVDLPEGAVVTIAVNDEREAEVELTPEELAEVDAALDDADRSGSVSMAVVLEALDRIARAPR